MSKNYGRERLQQAIATLASDVQAALDRAEPADNNVTLAIRIWHRLQWGLANAWMGVESCLAEDVRSRQIAEDDK